MGVEKAEIKRGAAHEIGSLLEDALEAGKRNVDRLEGSHVALLGALKRVEALLLEVDGEIDEKNLDLKQGKIAKTWVAKAMAVVAQMGTNAKREQVAVQGEARGLEKSVRMTKKVYDIEDAKVQRAAAQVMEEARADGTVTDLVPGKPRRRANGEKPVSSVKKRRKKKATKKRSRKA